MNAHQEPVNHKNIWNNHALFKSKLTSKSKRKSKSDTETEINKLCQKSRLDFYIWWFHWKFDVYHWDYDCVMLILNSCGRVICTAENNDNMRSAIVNRTQIAIASDELIMRNWKKIAKTFFVKSLNNIFLE